MTGPALYREEPSWLSQMRAEIYLPQWEGGLCHVSPGHWSPEYSSASPEPTTCCLVVLVKYRHMGTQGRLQEAPNAILKSRDECLDS